MVWGILSDIHSNLSALQAVLDDCLSNHAVDEILLLGDIIDYGMRPNECVQLLASLSTPIVANLLGNHEDALLNGKMERFSSERGRAFSRYTLQLLTQESKTYLSQLNASGYQEIQCGTKSLLAVHGSLADPLWGSISPAEHVGAYHKFDIVFSGHSHRSHCFCEYYQTDNQKMRNQKKTLFINPGSVGQPRNHNPFAQYAIVNFDSESVALRAVPYNILDEQKLYNSAVDTFYCDRLSLGV